MADKDYYKILGVERNATKEEIKKAYKRLAKKYHPDISKEPDAEKKFKEINEAASVLGDDEKRTKYDQYGSTYDQMAGKGFDASDFGFSGFGDFGSFDFEDIFERFFGGGFQGSRARRSGRGADLRYDIEISLEEAARGTEKEIVLQKNEKCSRCEGSGAKSKADIKMCPQCNGRGAVKQTRRTPFGMFATTTTCPKCRGAGEYIKEECPVCDGTGLVNKTKKIKISIPAGAENGTNLRISGEGEAGQRGAGSGDLYVVVHVKEHDVFSRQGDDLYVNVKISFVTAALGGEIEVPTIDGKARLKIPAGTQSNTVFRLKGKGIPYLHGHGSGSEYVEVIIDVPKKLTTKQKNILRQFEKESGKKGILDKIF